MGKGEIARNEQFLLFPQCFQKACFPGVSKGVNVWDWVTGLTLYSINTHFDASSIDSFENIVGKGEIACDEQFLLFPQCFLLKQKLVSPTVLIFDIISLFTAELEEPNIGILGKGLRDSFTKYMYCLLSRQKLKIKVTTYIYF